MKKKSKKLIFILVSLFIHIVILYILYNIDNNERKNVYISSVGASIFYHIYVLLDICINWVNK